MSTMNLSLRDPATLPVCQCTVVGHTLDVSSLSLFDLSRHFRTFFPCCRADVLSIILLRVRRVAVPLYPFAPLPMSSHPPS